MVNKSKEIIDLENRIRSPKHDNFRIVALLMLRKTPEEMERIRNSVSPLFRGLLSMSYLKRTKIEDVLQSGYYVEKETPELYGLILYLFRYHYSFLNKYVALRDRTYDLYLKGKNEEALSLLDDIDKLSHSMWSERFRMAILKSMQDEGRFLKYYRNLMDKNLSPKLRYLLRYTNNSQTFNTEDNEANEKNAYEMLTTGIDNKQLRDFYLSYCCPFNKLETENWLSVSLNSSIIDIYECMLVNLRHLTDATINNSQFREYISQINNLITDNMLQRWCYNEIIDNSKIHVDSENVNLQNLYLSEKYRETWDKGVDYINKTPRDIAIQIMVAKSIVYKGNTDEITIDNGDKQIADILFMNMVIMFMNEKTKDTGIETILGACYSLNFILELRSLYIFTKNYNNIFIDHSLDDFWKYSPSLSLYDIKRYKSDEEQKGFLKKWCNVCGYNEEEALRYIQDLQTAELFPLQLGTDVSNQMSYIESSFSSHLIPSYWLDGVATYIFNRYLKEDRSGDALHFFIDNTINDKFLTIVRSPEVIDKISDNYDLLYEFPLEMAIFRTMTEMPDDDRFDAYLAFLESENKKYASELEISGDEAKMLYFLSEVCDLSVLWQHVDVLKSSRQVYDERIKICKKILEVKKSIKISKEISDIIQQQKIKSLTRKVDESKIFVDVSGICKKELESEHTLFDIYQNFDMLKDDHRELITNDSDDKDNNGARDDANEIKRNIFKGIFAGVRDKFLFDPKFGLDFFLSTRIRHGTLMNQLRHSFENYHLITNKNADDVYADDEYWSEDKFDLNYAKTVKVKSIISDFSRRIDSLIVSLKDKCIQIKTENSKDNDSAAFDFSMKALSDIIIETYDTAKGYSGFSDVVSLIISKLWEHTSDCLLVARDRLSDFSDECTSALDQLDNDICSMFPNNRQSAFHNDVINCKGAVIGDVELVKSWFQLKNTSDFDFKIKDVYDTSITYVKNVHQIPLHIKDNIKSNSLFVHRNHFVTLYDMFSDMFNNTYNYSVRRSKPGNSLNPQMEITEDSQFLYIQFSNMVDVEDEPRILSEIEERKANFSKYIEQGLSRTIKKTGIVRMMILTKNALGDPNNDIDLQLENHRFVVSIKLNKSPLIS